MNIKRYVFSVSPSTNGVSKGTVLEYPDEYAVEGDENVWNAQNRSFYENGQWTIYDKLTLTLPASATVGSTLTAQIALPAGSPDTEVQLTFSHGSTPADPVTLPVTNLETSQDLYFDTEGVYTVTVTSVHHGSASVEVTVNAAA